MVTSAATLLRCLQPLYSIVGGSLLSQYDPIHSSTGAPAIGARGGSQHLAPPPHHRAAVGPCIAWEGWTPISRSSCPSLNGCGCTGGKLSRDRRCWRNGITRPRCTIGDRPAQPRMRPNDARQQYWFLGSAVPEGMHHTYWVRLRMSPPPPQWPRPEVGNPTCPWQLPPPNPSLCSQDPRPSARPP
jgi:hypothetical protein